MYVQKITLLYFAFTYNYVNIARVIQQTSGSTKRGQQYCHAKPKAVGDRLFSFAERSNWVIRMKSYLNTMNTEPTGICERFFTILKLLRYLF